MRIYLAFILLFSSLLLSAQLNPKHIFENAKVSELNTIYINSYGWAPTVTRHPDSGSDTLDVDYVSPNLYALNFGPTNGFIGDTELTIEYFQHGSIPGIPFPNYSTVHYRVKSSKIDLTTDYQLVTSDTVLIDPLLNDTSSDGLLTLDKLGQVEGGSASINGNKIQFSFDAGASNAYIRYFAKDSTGNIESSVIHCVAENDAVISTNDVFVDELSAINLLLPSDSYEISHSPNLGVINNVTGALWNYNPNIDGLDTLIFTTINGGLVQYNINVLNNYDISSFVEDDQVFCLTNGAIEFNVFDNDLKLGQTINDYSPELIYNGNGQFSFTPDTDFTGDKTFFYKVFSGWQFHIGNITIHVDDFAPAKEIAYSFDILKNHDLSLHYNNYIEDYYFSTVTGPSNGTITILDANHTEILECATITGENKIIYTPNADFDGVDEFDIEYCTNSGICEILKVDVNILDSNYGNCLCIESCVFQGDNNDDGVVNMKDILDLGLNVGEGGYARTNDFSLFWTGQESIDWGYDQMGAGLDLKCGDADGDGYIDENDFVLIDENYNQLHSFLAEPVGSLSAVPFTFVPQQTSVDSGEWLDLDIYVGNLSNPAIDFYGLAFSFKMAAELIDSSSVSFELAENSWLNFESPINYISKVPLDGQVDIGITRVSNISADGIGLVGTLSFIVEDELEGFKGNAILDHLKIKMNNIISTNEFGEYSKHPDFEDGVDINSKSEFADNVLESLLKVYPNPTAEIVTIQSERFSIDFIEVYDAIGRRVNYTSNPNSLSYNIDMSGLQQGIYFCQVHSNGAVTTKKIQKIN